MQTSIVAWELPTSALLGKYAFPGAYTDCYYTEVPRTISLDAYIQAFYTTWVFKLERWILARAVGKPSSDAQAERLARGEIDCFAAWTVEARAPQQLLMCVCGVLARGSWSSLSTAAPDCASAAPSCRRVAALGN